MSPRYEQTKSREKNELFSLKMDISNPPNCSFVSYNRSRVLIFDETCGSLSLLQLVMKIIDKEINAPITLKIFFYQVFGF